MKQLSLGMESIAFQDTAFFKALTCIFTDILESGVKSDQELVPYLTRLDRCAYDFIKITTLTISHNDTSDNFALASPSLSKGNVLNPAKFNQWLDKNFSINDNTFFNVVKSGWVDPTNSQVGGAFSEIVNKIYVARGFIFNKRYTAEDLAAAYLHEVGHAFNFICFLADNVIVNHVLQRSYQELTSQNVDRTVRVILEKTATDLDIKNKSWLEAIEVNTDKDVAFRILVAAVQIEPREMDNKRFFDYNTSEELADIFAARHGAAKAIVTLRSKMPPAKTDIGFITRTAVMYSLLGTLLQVVSGPVGAVFAFAGLFTTAKALQLAGNTPDIATFKQQATKMRNQLVEQLKQTKLPKDEINPILDSLDAIDDLIQADRDTKAATPALVRLIDLLRRGKIDARASREYTDKLEVLVANDLFVRAAQFRAK